VSSSTGDAEMSFIVRQISRTADGREIIRPTTYDTASITIGRDAGCEIHLADLAVELAHAQISQAGPAQILIESVSGLGFDVDGKTTTRATINPAKGAELRFGSHRLTVSEEGGAAVIAAERVEALSDASGEKEEIGLFTLKGLLPGRRISAWVLTLFVLAAFLAWPISSYVSSQGVKERPKTFHADTVWSSGPLSLAHKGLKDNCQACHTQAFVAVRDNTCIACHKDAHDHAAPNRLAGAKAPPDLGGRILAKFAHAFDKPAGRCVECHTEHEGAGPMQPTAQQFCSNCHADLSRRLTDTKIADAGDFGTAHPQFQATIMTPAGTRQRVSLSTKPVDDSGLKFPHALHLSRINGVARMAQTMRGEFGFSDALACKDCHTPTADGVRFQPVEMKQSCGMCHSLAFEKIGDTVRTLRHGEPRQVVADLRAYYRSGGPLQPANIGGQAYRRRPGDYAQGHSYFANFGGLGISYGRADSAIRAVFSKGGACYDCHTIFAPPPGSDDWRVRPVQQTMRYMQKGWFDHGAHKTEKCGTCHQAGQSNAATDLLLPGIKTCRDCHGGESARADVPSSCAMCHSYHAGDGAPWVSGRRVVARRGDGEGESPSPHRPARE
jgi:Cytochrome c3